VEVIEMKMNRGLQKYDQGWNHSLAEDQVNSDLNPLLSIDSPILPLNPSHWSKKKTKI